MTIWDTLTGRKSSSSPSSSHPSSTPSSGDSAPTTVFADAPFIPEAQQVSDFLQTPDISQLHPLAGLSRDDLEYLSLDESVINDLPGSRSALPSRGWSDDLCYGTGITYLSALTIGGAWGLAEGLRKTPSTAPPKIRLNGVLNAVTRRGPFLGNSAGVIALVYNGINSYIGYARGKHDAANSIVSGALAGAIFKSTRGIKPMMISSGLVATAAGTWAMTRKVLL